MRIFFYCNSLLFGFGGMEKTVCQLANYLVEHGHTVAIGHFEREDGRVAYPLNPAITLLQWGKDHEETLLLHAMNFAPDVILAFGASAHIKRMVSILRVVHAPIIIHEGTNPERCITKNWMNPEKISRSQAIWEREMTYAEADTIRFTLDEYKKSLSPFLQRKAVAFPNAFASDQIRTGPTTGKHRIINVGGLKKNKNIFPLLKAFSKICTDFPDWELAIFSHYSPKGIQYLSSIQNFIKENDPNSQMIIYPPTEDIYAEYSKTDIHVITSESEGLPNAVAEAMTCGIPSIGFAHCPGVNALIKHNQNGLLVEADADESITIDRLAGSLATLMKDEALRKKLGQSALKDSAIFSPQKVYDAWMNVITNAYAHFNDPPKEPAMDEDPVVSLHYARMKKNFWGNVWSQFESVKELELALKLQGFKDENFFLSKERIADERIRQLAFF